MVRAGRRQHSNYDLSDWLSDQYDYGTAPGAQDDQHIVNAFTALGLQSRRRIEQSDAAGNFSLKQLTTWDHFANGKLKQLTTTNGSGASLESHMVDYLDGAGIYVNGNRTRDSFSLKPGAGASGPCYPNTCHATYAYDPRDRLLRADDGHGTVTAYTLDGTGNILTEARSGSPTRTYSYQGNQLQQVTSGGQSQRYWYDSLGRLACVTSGSGSAGDCGPGESGASANLLQDYRYDYLDRLALYRGFGGGSQTDRAEYTYDALDRLAEEKELHPSFGGVVRTTQFGYLGQSRLQSQEQQSNSTGTLGVKDYSYDAFGRRLGLTDTPYSGDLAQPSSTYTYGYDVHGSVSLLLDAGGNPRASYGYQPYGQPDAALSQGDADALNPLNPFRFSGKRQDSGSGTLDMGARRFGPDVSRFLTPDLFYGALADLSLSVDPLTQNRYGLAGGNPIGFREWDGHMVLADGGGGASSSPSPGQDEPGGGGGVSSGPSARDGSDQSAPSRVGATLREWGEALRDVCNDRETGNRNPWCNPSRHPTCARTTWAPASWVELARSASSRAAGPPTIPSRACSSTRRAIRKRRRCSARGQPSRASIQRQGELKDRLAGVMMLLLFVVDSTMKSVSARDQASG